MPTDSKVLLIASVNSGDGKTTCALAMASMASANGLRTVLVDCDPHENGAAARLQVKSFDFEPWSADQKTTDMVSVSPVYPHLNVVAARPSVHDCGHLFGLLEKSFDLVIVDAPASSETQEALWLSTYVDSVLVIVSSSATRERELASLADRLNLSNALLLGGVLNFHGRPQKLRERYNWHVLFGKLNFKRNNPENTVIQ